MLEVLKYTIPSLVVFITVFYIVKSYFDDQEKRRRYKALIKNKELITPIQLQAYERMILLLERISPESLIIRVSQTGMTNKQLQTEMLASIRAEFEHNLSQQLYISVEAWERVKNARATTIKMINTAADKLKPDGPYIQLSSAILDMSVEVEKTPNVMAIEFIKNDMKKLL